MGGEPRSRQHAATARDASAQHYFSTARAAIRRVWQVEPPSGTSNARFVVVCFLLSLAGSTALHDPQAISVAGKRLGRRLITNVRSDSPSNETLSPLEILKRENELLRRTVEATGGLMYGSEPASCVVYQLIVA